MPVLSAPTPILRSFDEDKAREFYCVFLGFKVEWEHRFEADLPLYMEIRRDACVIHLSEHHGDATPGARIRIAVDDVRALHGELIARRYKHARPGVGAPPWGGAEMTVTDPFGNNLTFFSS